MPEQFGLSDPTRNLELLADTSEGWIVHFALNSGDWSGGFELLTGTPRTRERYQVTSADVSSDEVRSKRAKERALLAKEFDYEAYRKRPLFRCLSPLTPSTDASEEKLVSTIFDPSTFPAFGRIPKIKGEKPRGFVPDPSVVKFIAHIESKQLRRISDIPDIDELIVFQKRLICPSKIFFVIQPGIADYDIQSFLRQQEPDESFAYPSGEAQREISRLLAQGLILSFGNGIDLASELVARATELGILLDLEDLHGAFSDLVSIDYCSTDDFKELSDLEQDAYFQIIAHWQLSLAAEINAQGNISKTGEITLHNVFPALSLDGKLPSFEYWIHIAKNTEKFIAQLGSIIPNGSLVRLEQIDGIVKKLDELLLRALEAFINGHLVELKQAEPRKFPQLSLQEKLQILLKKDIPETDRARLDSMINFIGDLSEKDYSKRRKKLGEKLYKAQNEPGNTDIVFSTWEQEWLRLEYWRSEYTNKSHELDKRKKSEEDASNPHVLSMRAQIKEITDAGGRETLSFKIRQLFGARSNNI